MTTGAPAPARAPTPRPKAAPTSGLSSESDPAVSPRATTTVPESGPGAPSQAEVRRGPRAGGADPLSDRSTAFLIRRILCPEQLEKGRSTPVPIEDILPPLTSRNDVDLQLYAIIAIILREFVQKWYSKITPDETFVAEIVQIIAHCTRALEQRLRKVDLESLLFDEIPDLLDKHVNTYRMAHRSVAQPPVQTDPREIYHALCPLPALSPVPQLDSPSSIAEQAENEGAYRQLLVQAVLAVLLPTEDLENDCLTALVGQIFSELIIGNNIANRIAEPWLIWECLIMLSRSIRQQTNISSDQPSTPNTDPELNGTRERFSFHGLILSILHWCFFAATFIRVLVAAVVSSRSLPPRSRYGASQQEEMTSRKTASHAMSPTSLVETRVEPVKVPVVAFRIWPAISNLIEMNVRMPWLVGALSMLQWIAMTGPGRIGDVDGILDRVLSHSVIQAHVVDVATLPTLLRNLRGTLFPNNAPGKPTLTAPSSDAELRALRRRCASSLWELVPKPLGSLYFGSGGRGAWPLGGWSARSFSASATSPQNLQYQQSGDGDASGKDQDQRVVGSGSQTAARPGPPSGPGSQPRYGPTNAHDAKTANPVNNAKYGSDRSGLAQSRRSVRFSASGLGSGRPGPQGQPGEKQEQSRQPPQVEVRAAQHLTVGTGVTGGQKDDVSGGGDGGGGVGSGDNYHQGDEEEEERILGEIETGILDVFGDAYSNKHLVYQVLELILLRLMPELGEKGAIELWEERLS